MAKKKLDFKKLFLHKHKLPIYKDDEVVGNAYQRILNDADVSHARAQALRASGELRKNLRDETSDDYYAYIMPLLDLETPEMIMMILMQEAPTRRTSIEQEILAEYPKKLKATASVEQREKYQAELDAVDDIRNQKISEALEKELEKRKEELDIKERKDLLPILRRVLTERICSMRLINVFQLWSAFMGTFLDAACTKPYFESYEEFSSLPSEVLEQFVDGYFALTLGAEEVKK